MDDDYNWSTAKAKRSVEIAQRVTEHFNNYGAEASCAVCGEDTFVAIADGPETGFGLFGTQLFGQRYMPVVAVKCVNCEHLILFNAKAILKELPPLEDFEDGQDASL